MGKQQYGRKRGNHWLKRPNKSEAPNRGRKAKSLRTKNDNYSRSASPSPSAGSIDEEQSVLEFAEEQVVYREPSMYDNLLQKLGSGSDSIANALRIRIREEEGRSDSEEDENDGSESSHGSEGEEEGSDSEYPGSLDAEISAERSHSDDFGEPIDTYQRTVNDKDEMSDTDEERDVQVISSSFDKHFGLELSQDEADKLKNQSYKWEMPAVDMPSCKWRGTGECFMKEPFEAEGYGLKPRLFEHWLKNYKDSGGRDFHSSKERHFFSICSSYRDVLHHNKRPFYLKGSEEDSRVTDAYIMHALNHIFKTRDLIKKNNRKLAKQQEGAGGDMLNDDGLRDQGFTRPKVLILLPLASIAHRIVKRLIKLTPLKNKSNGQRPEAIVENLKRFDDEYGADKDHEHENDVENSTSKKSSKPSDYQALFGGNNNDHFMIGIKFTRGSIRLYSDFYSSDVIVASPLALITKFGEAVAVKEKEKDVDYLSSIEVLIIDHADVILMQNWSHVQTVEKQLNRTPSKVHRTDIMRIRKWYLDGFAKSYRQTIVLSSHLSPDINAFFNHHCRNYEGKVKLASEYKGVLSKVLLNIPQQYRRFDADSIADADDARFEFFCKKVFPQMKDSIQGGIMLFISSYLEFVRLRNFLKAQDASFCLLGEYTKQSDISRARIWFFQGQRKIMLYTERAHFYHRYKIRGIQNLIIYSLPERKEFYSEIVNMLEESQSCTVLYSRYDQLRLERVVGSSMTKKMIKSKNDLFVVDY